MGNAKTQNEVTTLKEVCVDVFQNGLIRELML